MFLNEARLAAKLDHPNIVRVYELGEVDGNYFISMEYLPAEDLTKIVNESRKKKQWIPPSIAAAVVQATADALQSAHDLTDDTGKPLGLVHRDVSLSNVMVTYHGLPKLADFGIAKATALPGRGTRAGTFKGKFAYAAPEQVTGKPVDSRTDVFALGIVLWELLTIRRLFKRENDAATIRAVEEAEVPPIRSIRPNVPRELEAIALKALAKKPKDRFQTAAEMSDALEEVLRQEGVSSSTKHLAKWLTALFGDQIANIKKSVAQGRLDMGSVNNGGLGLAAEDAALIGLAPIAPKRKKTVSETASSGERPPSVTRAPPAPPPKSRDPLPADTVRSSRPSHPALEPLSGGPRAASYVASVPSARAAWSTEFAVQAEAMSMRTPSQSSVSNFSEPPRWSGSGSSASMLPGELPPSAAKRLVVAVALAVLFAGLVIIGHRLVLRMSPRAPQGPLGVVRFDRLPPEAKLVVDDRPIRSGDVVELPIGSRSVRVELRGKVVLSRTIEVRPGDQTVDLQIQ
jgi:serine/threonine protein kinase